MRSSQSHVVKASGLRWISLLLLAEIPWAQRIWALPVVEKLARDYEGRLKVAKLNVDENPQTAMRYQVQGIPTLLLFKGGRMVDRIVGAAPEPLLRGKVDAALRG